MKAKVIGCIAVVAVATITIGAVVVVRGLRELSRLPDGMVLD